MGNIINCQPPQFNVIILGMTASGKTSLVDRAMSKPYRLPPPTASGQTSVITPKGIIHVLEIGGAKLGACLDNFKNQDALIWVVAIAFEKQIDETDEELRKREWAEIEKSFQLLKEYKSKYFKEIPTFIALNFSDLWQLRIGADTKHFLSKIDNLLKEIPGVPTVENISQVFYTTGRPGDDRLLNNVKLLFSNVLDTLHAKKSTTFTQIYYSLALE